MKNSELVAPLIQELEAAADALEKLGPKWWSVKSFKYRIVLGPTTYSLTCHAFRPEEIRERARQIAKTARDLGDGCSKVGTAFQKNGELIRRIPTVATRTSTKRPPKPITKVAEQFLSDQEPDNYKAYLALWD